MKIQCDVCNKEEAAVFCSADEAALCDGCDRRVHNANKLVSQHKRHSLRPHTFQDFPLCDICQVLPPIPLFLSETSSVIDNWLITLEYELSCLSINF